MKLSMTRRGFVLGSASAAVLAGLAGCGTPGASEAKKESVVTATKPASEHEYYKSDYAYTKDGEKQLVADEAQAFATAVGEGIVLLKNEAGALPLSPADGKVVAFGNATIPRLRIYLIQSLAGETLYFAASSVIRRFFNASPCAIGEYASVRTPLSLQ